MSSNEGIDYDTYISTEGKQYKKEIEVRLGLLEKHGNEIYKFGVNFSRPEIFDDGKYRYFELCADRKPFRIMYFMGKNNEIVIATCYTKNTDKLPENIKRVCRRVYDSY